MDRRVVDRITIGDARSEREHAYAGEEVSSGVAGGRQTRGWMRFALNVFDDTEVTIACTFAGGDVAQTFDLVVENQVVASHTFRSRESRTVEFRVPLALTRSTTPTALPTITKAAKEKHGENWWYSDDGFMAWNILDAVLGGTPAPTFYPVLRTMEAVQ